MSLRVGVVGCGNISDIYLANGAIFSDIEIVACADIRPSAAEALAARFGIAALSVENLLAAEEIDIVLNLTVPAAHKDVSLAALAAGKHVYSEKPLATTVDDGRIILKKAADSNLRVGAAPDTIFSAPMQLARRLVDQGQIGRPLLGLANILSHGMEDWHPNPEFFYKEDGGPALDMGPYYVGSLVALLGPVRSVVASGQIGNAERIVGTEDSPFRGQKIKVETFTSIQTILEFCSGAQVSLAISWDVWRHRAPYIELHGTDGSLSLPDPDKFGGTVMLARRANDWEEFDTANMILGRPNYQDYSGFVANYRGVGLAEMAQAIKANRPHRASGEFALHTLSILKALQASANSGHRIEVGDTTLRPEALTQECAQALLLAEK